MSFIWQIIKSYKYDKGIEVFRDLNFKIKAFEKVGIVGVFGAGKSTLIFLLLKNFTTTSGDIIIDSICSVSWFKLS